MHEAAATTATGEALSDILEYLMTKTKQELNKKNVYVLANNYNNENIYIINRIVSKVKNLQIVSSNIKNYMNLEDKIFEKKRNTNCSFKQ